MSHGASDQDFFYVAERRYVRPDWRRLFPRFDIKEVGSLLKELTGEQWSDDALRHQYLSYRVYAIWFRVIAATGLIGLILSFALYLGIKHARDIDSWVRSQSILVMPIVGLAIAMLIALTVAIWQRLGSRGRFFRLMQRAEYSHSNSVETAESNYAQAVAVAGRGARCLFAALQGTRLTWKAPPTVADYALGVTYPLINVRICTFPESASSGLLAVEYYARFLHDIAALVMLNREDLVPLLRERYSMLPIREASEEGDIPERDALYIDPMRNHHRWSVVKDYLFPVASWLSLLLSLVAFVVSTSR